MNTPIKYNGPKLDAIIMAAHLSMHNYDTMNKKPGFVRRNLGYILAIGLMAYTCSR